MQQTIQNPVSCYGIGLHSGKRNQTTLRPAKSDTGIVFIRKDVTRLDNKILARYDNVCATNLSTSIKNSAGVQVSTIEHLMAAIWGCNIDNLIVEIDGQEVPIMDGSSKPFIFMLEYAGKKVQNKPRKYLKLNQEVVVEDNGCRLIAVPDNDLCIDLSIDFPSPVIGKQCHMLKNKNSFKQEISDSRTFGFLHELEYLQNRGLAQGASLDNVIGIDKDVILNHDGLRHDNEFVRHKILDLVGDFFNVGGNFVGKINGHKTSHALNNKFLRKIFENQNLYSWVTEEELALDKSC